MSLTIHTNNVPREIVYALDLTAKERQEFDYIDWEAVDRGEEGRDFVRYKGEIYDLGEFQITSPGPREFAAWDGYQSDSYFSGALMRYVREGGRTDRDSVVMAWYSS